jgi:hypothetical protein
MRGVLVFRCIYYHGYQIAHRPQQRGGGRILLRCIFLWALIIAFIVFEICSAAHQIELSLGLAGSFIERASSQNLGRVVIPGREAYVSVGH